MPELPEVETVSRDLRKCCTGRSILNARVFDSRVIKNLSPRAFILALKNKSIKQVTRRAKAIIMTFDEGGFLVVQLGMTGHFIFGEKWLEGYSPKDIKASFDLSGGEKLFYLDQRMFGWLIAVDRLEEIPYLNTAGPEPLSREFNPGCFAGAIKERAAPIKNLLLNQNIVAGLGNIYASEILFSAGVHPARRADSLTETETALICRHTKEILKDAIRLRGTSMRNYRDSRGQKGGFLRRIRVYGRDGEPCCRCGRPIEKIVQAGRSSFFCKNCQVM